MEVIGISERAIEAVLNHSGGKRKPVTVSTCLHSDLSLAKLDALARWQAAVEDILDGFDPFSVRVEDRDAVIAKALARDHDGKPRLRVVG